MAPRADLNRARTDASGGRPDGCELRGLVLGQVGADLAIDGPLCAWARAKDDSDEGARPPAEGSCDTSQPALSDLAKRLPELRK